MRFAINIAIIILSALQSTLPLTFYALCNQHFMQPLYPGMTGLWATGRPSDSAWRYPTQRSSRKCFGCCPALVIQVFLLKYPFPRLLFKNLCLARFSFQVIRPSIDYLNLCIHESNMNPEFMNNFKI